MAPPLNDKTRYLFLKLIESKPEISQRELAREIGVSLGKVNYCLSSLIERGWVKVTNFSKHPDKRVYAYCLTSKGVKERAQVTARFLKIKLAEREEIKREIVRLRQETRMQGMVCANEARVKK